MRRNFKDEAKRWLEQAKDEFCDADQLRLRNRFYLALFHFQQATEKALKAYLYSVVPSQEVFFTHSISELIQLACEKDKDFKDVSLSAKLDQYYIPTRYPNGLSVEIPSRFYNDPEEARQAMLLAKNVIELVKKKLY
ncbi:MAG: HEPN domain-containing protein [Candidatus Aenigmatarchaeota archaeon]